MDTATSGTLAGVLAMLVSGGLIVLLVATWPHGR